MAPEELKASREAAGMTRQELGSKVGLTERQIYRYEDGTTPINPRSELALRQALNGHGTLPKPATRRRKRVAKSNLLSKVS